MTVPLLYTAELDLPDQDVEAFSHWYAYRHTPDLYQAGFQTCTCYRVLDGDMNLFDLYEAPGWDIFENPSYLAMRGRDPYMDGLMAKRRTKAHTVYEQRRIMPEASGPCLDADWLHVLRFDAPMEADSAVGEAIRQRCSVLTGQGVTRIRFACRTKDHPRNPTFRPRCMIVLEAGSRLPGDPFAGWLPPSLTGASAFTGQRIYPWPDRPQ